MSLESSPLTLLCTIHHVIITNNQTIIGEQYTIEAYLSTNESILLQCFPISLSHVAITPEQHQSLPEMTIHIASQSELRLEHSFTLIVPHLDNDHSWWSLNCSASDPQEFITLQDMLTHFGKFENRQNIRNTIAMVDSSSYKVTRVVEENIFMDQDEERNTNSVVDDSDDFLSARENYYGQKLPVAMDEHTFHDGLELRKVRLIQKTSQCMEVSSKWLTRGIVSAGDSIASFIESGSIPMEHKNNTQLVSSKQRIYFDIFFNITTMIGNTAGEWFSKLFCLTALKQKASMDIRMPTPTSQLGNSALQATHRVMKGSLAATGTILSASRQRFIYTIETKYGVDAGYMVEKIIGSDKSDDDVMVYFDHHGISRKVVMQPSNLHKSTTNEQSTSFTVYEEEKSSDHPQVVYDSEEKKSEKLVLV